MTCNNPQKMDLRIYATQGIAKIKKAYANIVIKDKDVSIIANNCLGADISHSLGLRFNSPTVDMQILPAEYIKFVSNLPHYLNQDVVRCEQFSSVQNEQIYRTYGRIGEELHFPIGLCGDILLFFQHYRSFEDAKSAWDRRKKRVIFDKLGIIFLGNEKFSKEMRLFDEIELEYGKKIIFSCNHDIKLSTRIAHISIPEGTHFMKNENIFRKYYEQNFNSIRWVKELSQ